jgi:hypothetical protein
MPSPNLKGYPKETVIAEKFHVMINRGLINSRMKDFYDIWLLSNQFDFDSHNLNKAIQGTFKKRKTTIPESITVFEKEFTENKDKNTQWKAMIKNLHLEHAPAELKDVMERIKIFLVPFVDKQNELKKIIWKAPGPWKKQN